jgi:hypothetical protein
MTYVATVKRMAAGWMFDLFFPNMSTLAVGSTDSMEAYHFFHPVLGA